MDEDDAEFLIEQRTLFIVLAAFSVVALCLLICFRRCGSDCKPPYITGFVGVFIITLASCLLFSYGTIGDYEDNFDYYGPMRIVGAEVQVRLVSHGCGRDWRQSCSFTELDIGKCTTCQSLVHTTTVTLDWGYDWACPNTDNTTICESTTFVKTCGSVACTRAAPGPRQRPGPLECSEEEHANASISAEECTRSKIFSSPDAYPPFSPNEDPLQNHTSWPTVERYGDCDTCQVEESIPSPDLLNGLKISGLFFLFLGVAVILTSILMCYLPTTTCCAVSDKAAVLQRVRRDGLTLRLASKELRNDLEVVMAAIRQNGGAIQYASPNLQNRRDIQEVALKQTPYAFIHVPKHLQDDKQVALQAVHQHGWLLKYASPRLQANRDVVLAAVQQGGRALQYASKELRADREIVLAAVRQRGDALEFASDDLKDDQNTDQNVVWEAVHTSGEWILKRKNMSKTMLRDPKIIAEAKRRTAELKAGSRV
ncbi:expressed unknown protein [Seminavis robusta]|uniref:DUF4116 domain-containing protein n=1 Tax=Seminavis robusta TaxID=568900 RepID=A0A9N8E7C3_9STRA|nr:expressed unknown protein [Seminavis robusta]|eukprot:Sro622_g176950.1 n/a (482) ;mRNA; f:25127-26572